MTLAIGEGPKRPDLITVSSSCVRVAHIFCFIDRLCCFLLFSFSFFFLAKPSCTHKCSEIIFGRRSNNPPEQRVGDVIGSFLSRQPNFSSLRCVFLSF